MIDQKAKKLLSDFALCILKTFNFSLIPTDENYSEPEIIAEMLGGGIEYDIKFFDTKVCRCGQGFIIGMYNDEKMRTYQFAEALTILFLKMGYKTDENKFMKRKNMQYEDRRSCREYVIDEDHVHFLTQELILPKSRLEKCVVGHINSEGYFKINDIIKELGFPYEFVETRLLETGMIESRWN